MLKVNNIMILVGSKIIKESYDIKAVYRNVYIMGRPDNIPTLIQIIGRTVRKNSHKNLPPDQRHVDIRIFTSCLPVFSKKLNTNEEMTKKHYNKKFYKNSISLLVSLQKDNILSFYELSYEEVKYKIKSRMFLKLYKK